MSRWFQAVRVAGYPTRYELEVAEWLSMREARSRLILDEDGVEFRVRYWGNHLVPYKPGDPSVV